MLPKQKYSDYVASLSDEEPRFSRFNHVLQNEGELLLVNALNGALFTIDEESADAILNRRMNFSAETLETLIDKGIVLKNKPADFELQYVEYAHNAQKFSKDVLGVTLLLTMSCNLRCVYCYEGAGVVSNATLDQAGYERVYKFITGQIEGRGLKGLSLCLFGGEPMLFLKDARLFLGKVKTWLASKGLFFSTTIITNGTLVDDESIKLLLDCNCTFEQVTLNGTKEIHDTRRVTPCGGGSFDETLAGIKKFHDSPLPKPCIRVNVDKTNLRTVRPLLQLLKKEGLNDCPLDFGIVKGNTPSCQAYESKCFEEEELGDVLESLWALAREEGFEQSVFAGRKFLFCGMFSDTSFTVTPDLGLYKCWDFVGQEEHRIGAIDEEGNMTAPTPAFFKWMTRSPLSVTGCADCGYLPVCGGGCGGMAENDKAEYRAPSCFKIKSVFEKEVLEQYHEKNLFQAPLPGTGC